MVGCDTIKFDKFGINKFTKTKNFYQTTSFTSSNFTEKMSEFRTFSLYQDPIVIYSFHKNRQKIYSRKYENHFKGLYAVQESLIIYHTNNLNEIKPFIDFLLTQLTFRKRPNCLVVYSINNFTTYEEVDTYKTLKFAWTKKFLDFTIMVTAVGSPPLVYHFNPFNGIVLKKALKIKGTEIFPDKLKNIYGYPLYTNQMSFENDIVHVRNPKKKLEVSIEAHFTLTFTAKVLNFSVVSKNITLPSDNIIPYDLFKKWNLDFYKEFVIGVDYLYYFVIPTDSTNKNVFAFVPIIPVPQTGGFFKMFVNLGIIFTIVIVNMYILSHFKATSPFLKGFDFVRILLGQSTSKEPKKLLHRIILLTIIVASVKITNDFLLDTLQVQFDDTEVPFETYEDLHNSKLQTFSYLDYLKTFDITNDPNLSKVLNRTIIVKDLNLINCFNNLITWKNASCITASFDVDYSISLSRDSNGSPTMKVAQPPIFVVSAEFYWFADYSPYAMKFLENMRRIQETDLMHWPALVYKNRLTLTIEPSYMKIDNDISTEQLLITLSFGYLTSLISFIIEFIIFKILRNLKMSQICIL